MSTMVWVASCKNFHELGWVGCKNFGLDWVGFQKVTHVKHRGNVGFIDEKNVPPKIKNVNNVKT